MKRMLIWTSVVLAAALAVMLGGLLLIDEAAPAATGMPGYALPVQSADTAIDRDLAPLLAAHPGETGAIFLADGLDAFAARAITALNAGRSLDLQYFIWRDDMAGRLLARKAYDAAQRGVRVRILLDDMNASGLDPYLLAMDAHPNIELRLYNPLRNRKSGWRALELVRRAMTMTHRMHNKAWIADGRVAIIGGRNIGEQYFSADSEMNFRDLDLLLLGPAVSQASLIFDDYWNSSAAIPVGTLGSRGPEAVRTLLEGVYRDAGSAGAMRYLARVADSHLMSALHDRGLQPHWSPSIQVVADPPLKLSGDNHAQWLVARLAPMISGAGSEVMVISPYFVPGEDGTTLLAAVGSRGAQVSVVTNSLAANDVSAVHSGYAVYRKRLLQLGVHLYELRGEAQAHAQAAPAYFGKRASLHTKAFVLDGTRGFVGSFNIDPRSKNLNTEMGVLFDDPDMGRALRTEFLRLATPDLSYQLSCSRNGELRWRDGTRQPAVMLEQEPDAGPWRRALARVAGWLPIESQL